MTRSYRLASLLVLGTLAATASACSSDDSGGTSGAGGASGSGGAAGAAGAINGPPAEGPITQLGSGWNPMEPGGDTICSRGDKYRFWVRPGKVNRVVVEFRDGGACWNALTCTPGADLFEEQANPEPWMSDETKAVGIYDHSRDDNPFKDWHHVYLSYCTGDVHWGNSKVTYQPGGPLESTVEHRGAVNAKAALAWVYANVPNPDKLMVAGCSAGGYGAAFWTPSVREHYTKAKVYQFSDSSAGIITDTFFAESFPTWNAKENFPVLTGLDPDTFKQLPELYIGLGKTYPEMFISEFNTAYDATQHKYYAAMGGGDANEWSTKMQGYLADISAGAPAFRSYLGAGYEHCMINKNAFYDYQVGGTKLATWLGDVVADKPVSNVSCKDSDCGAPKPAQ